MTNRYRIKTALALITAILFLLPASLHARRNEVQPRWVNDLWRSADYPQAEWYVGFSSLNVPRGMNVEQYLQQARRDAQNKMSENIIVHHNVTSTTEGASTLIQQDGQNNETIIRNYSQIIQVTANARVVGLEQHSYHDPRTNMVFAIAAVRKSVLAAHYASQIDAGLNSAQRELHLALQTAELGESRRALQQLAASKAHIDSVSYYRDLLLTVDSRNGRQNAQETRVKELLYRINATRIEIESGIKPLVLLFVTGNARTSQNELLLLDRFTTIFAADTVYDVISASVVARQIEQIRQQRESPAIDRRIREIGAGEGAKYICMINLSRQNNTYTLQAHLIDIETGKIFGPSGTVDNMRQSDPETLRRAADRVYSQMTNRAATAFDVAGVTFDNADAQGAGVIDSFVTTFNAFTLKILVPRMTYSNMGAYTGNVTLNIKIVNPFGETVTYRTSPAGYTHTGQIHIQSGSRDVNVRLPGWNYTAGDYPAGNYTHEIWYSGQKLHSANFTVHGTKHDLLETEVGLEMVYIKGGVFDMGCTDGQEPDCFNDERPAARINAGDFYISRYPVTQRQWKLVMGRDCPSGFRGNDNLPVESVTYSDALTFIQRLNALTGKQYRLPTEEEWEYAARGGVRSRDRKYAGSDNIDAVAWHGGNSGGKTHPAGTKAPNELWIYDMSGNVGEWVDANLLEGSRMFRGGSWNNNARNCRVSSRRSVPDGTKDVSIGFRLAITEQ